VRADLSEFETELAAIPRGARIANARQLTEHRDRHRHLSLRCINLVQRFLKDVAIASLSG
jgi:hypothetical protein